MKRVGGFLFGLFVHRDLCTSRRYSLSLTQRESFGWSLHFLATHIVASHQFLIFLISRNCVSVEYDTVLDG